MKIGGVTTSSAEDQGSDYGRWLIHGPQGTGKSTLASTLAEIGPQLFIDLVGEKGTRSFQGAPYAGNIQIARPDSITALDDVYWALASGDHPFKSVVIDSLTSVQKMAMRYLLGHDETAVKEIQRGTTPADMRTWGQALDIMQDVATFWFGLADADRPNPIHVAMTAQTKVTEDEDKVTSRVPDVQKGALSLVLAAPDYVLYTDMEENPDHYSDESLPKVRHVVRFGSNPEYRTKARVPVNLRGKIPTVLGRKRPLTLPALSKTLGVGGITTAAPAAADTTSKEQ